MRDLRIFFRPLLGTAAVAATALLALPADAAAPGIVGVGAGTSSDPVVFDLTAAPGYISQPDGLSVYSWGYGCTTAPADSRFRPENIGVGQGAKCPAGQMQLPGPTLIVNQGDTVSVTLTNNLPAAAGNTSILFPGFAVSTSGGSAGLLAQEAAHGGTVTYTFVATTAGTHQYYSGTQGDLQVEMGLYGALIVLPSTGGSVPTGYSRLADHPDTCHQLYPGRTAPNGDPDFRLAAAAYDNPQACYDREYMFQFSSMDPVIHGQAEVQAALPCTQPTGCMVVATEPYVPAYFMVNGRSMPDLMDPNYALQYPHQPYNGNPHMHPGEHVLLRLMGDTEWQHPFHEHGNHVRILARDGHMLLTPPDTDPIYDRDLAGPALFTTTVTPGQTMDGIFEWTGKGLNWDIYGHSPDVTPGVVCNGDANGYYTTASGAPVTAINYYEWCADHNVALEAKPFGQVGQGGPVTLPDPNLFANGPWYGGSPYLGPEANERAVGATPIPPSGTVGNSPTEEAGFAFIWHSHNERELTTNNAFPGGMFMMLLVDPWNQYVINEVK